MGFSNFMGERPKQTKEIINAQISVSDYMTKRLIHFSPQDSLIETMETLARNEITGGPVISKGKLVGMISESDCMKILSESRYFNMPMGSETVEKHMSNIVETIDSNASIFEAAEQFHKSPYKRFPVMENGNLVGQISQHDVIIAALHLNSQNWKY